MSASHDGISIVVSRSWHFVRYKIVDDVVEMLMKKREKEGERERERGREGERGRASLGSRGLKEWRDTWLGA